MKKKCIPLPSATIGKARKILLVMKWVTFFLFVGSLSLSATTYSQRTKIDLQIENSSVEQILHEIEKSSKFIFIYDAELIGRTSSRSISTKKQGINSVLRELFQGTDIEYLIDDRQIFLYQGDNLRTLAPNLSAVGKSPGQVEIRGTVKDQEGVSLPGVAVVVKGTTIGTITDIDGKYTLTKIPESGILVFSFMGMKSLELGYSGQKILDVIMDEETKGLEEVVIVGYGSQKKESVTGSIASVVVKQLEQSSTPSLSIALGGKIPGIITRQSSGEPGFDQAVIHIRGMASWVSNKPLILVDGVERDMNAINTQEIESMYILKDASATAVYGVRGANGVIIITTKKGKIGKPSITFRTEDAILSPVRLPDYINGLEYAKLINEALATRGENPRFSDEDIQKFEDGSDPYLYPNVDWVNEVLKKETYQTINNLNISGGSELLTYFMNVGYTSQDGLYKGDNLNKYNTNANLERYNFRSRVDLNLSRSLSMNLGIGGIIQHRNYPGNDSYYIFNAIKSTSPIAYPVRNPDGTPGAVAPDGLQGLNPWAVATQQGYRSHHYNTIQSTFGVRWDLSSLITPGLSVNGKFSYDYNSSGGANRPKFFEIKQYLGKATDTGEDLYVVHREEEPLGYMTALYGNRSLYLETTVNYEKKVGLHELAAMFMYNQSDYVDITSATTIGNLPSRHQGIAGRLTYDYNRRYLFEFNFGYNGSENFPKGDRFGFFPSVSGGWVISNEDFWKIPFISNMKIRGSYGQAGNDQSGTRFLFLTTMRTTGDVNYYYYGQDMTLIPGIEEGQTGSEDVTWEVATKLNAGLDLNLFKDKVQIQFDTFKESRTGILIQRQDIPTMAGFYGTPPYGNLGEAENKGVDGQIEIKNTFSNGLFCSFIANGTFAKNKILENDEPLQKYSYQSQKGNSINQVMGLVALGFFKDQEDIDTSPKQTFMSVLRPGDIKYQDVNADGQIDFYDRVPIGRPRTPELMYGFGGTLAYKGFDFSVYFTGAARTSFFLGGKTMSPFYGGENNILREYYDLRWIPGANNEYAKYPLVINEKNENNFIEGVTSTLWMRDGSYLRLKNAEVGFSLPASICGRLKMQNIRIFINGINLYTWDNIKIFDPESDSGDGGYPIQKSINAGLQVTF